MEQTPSPQVAKNNKTKKSNKALIIIPWVGLALFIITAALAGYLYVTKQLIVPALGGTAPTTTVCDSAIVTTYNTAMTYTVKGSDIIPSLDDTGLQNLDKEIRSKANFAQDPTCQTILFWTAIHANDADKARTALSAINKLHDKGHYPDSNIRTSQALFDLQSYIDNLPASSVGGASD